MNDSPVGCQNRGVTESQREKGDRVAVDEGYLHLKNKPKFLLKSKINHLKS